MTEQEQCFIKLWETWKKMGDIKSYFSLMPKYYFLQLTFVATGCVFPAQAQHPLLPLQGGGYQRRMTISSKQCTHSNTTTFLSPAGEYSGWSAQILGPAASRALALYFDCLVNCMPARFLLQAKRGGQQISFTCRDTPPPWQHCSQEEKI
jgi:hypothetical protein